MGSGLGLLTAAEYLLRADFWETTVSGMSPTHAIAAFWRAETQSTLPAAAPGNGIRSRCQINSSTATGTSNIYVSQKEPPVRNLEIFLECSKEEPNILGASPGAITCITDQRGMKQWTILPVVHDAPSGQ